LPLPPPPPDYVFSDFISSSLRFFAIIFATPPIRRAWRGSARAAPRAAYFSFSAYFAIIIFAHLFSLHFSYYFSYFDIFHSH
jgi:hypothetical protein